jgi:hypothetical protein
MPIGTPEGFLDITNATLRTSVVGISNTGPTGELSIGSNLHVDTTSSNVLHVVGNTLTHNLTLGTINLTPAYGLENVVNVGSSTSQTVTFSNITTGLTATTNVDVQGQVKATNATLGLVATSNIEVGGQVKATNPTLGLVATSNIEVGGQIKATNPTLGLVTTSNAEVGTANLYVDTTTGRVGIGSTQPRATLDINKTDAMILPSGTTAEEPATGITGMVRLNTTIDKLQFYNGNRWSYVGGGSVSDVSPTNLIAESGPHGRGDQSTPTPRKFPGFPMTSNTTPLGYVASASSTYQGAGSGYAAWKAFDGVIENRVSTDNPIPDAPYYYDWKSAQSRYVANGLPVTTLPTQTAVSGDNVAGEWLQIEVPKAFKLTSTYGYPGHSGDIQRAPKVGKIVGSNDGTTWTLVHSFSDLLAYDPASGEVPMSTQWAQGSATSFGDISPDVGYYRYYRLITTQVNENVGGHVQLNQWELYGISEDDSEFVAIGGDTSTDVTIKSQYNTPAVSGYKLYLDGAEGSTATDLSTGPITVTENNVTYDATEKAWVFDGSTESNIVSATLGFEGDQPLSVSTWFKSSNLETNVSTSTIFNVGTAGGEGFAKAEAGVDLTTLITEDTWHNLAFTSNGQGLYNHTYLDGNLIGSLPSYDSARYYPEIPLLRESQDGYNISASSDYNNFYSKTKPFNHHAIQTENWATFNGGFSDTINYSGTARLASTTPLGEWLKLEMPHPILMTHIFLSSYDAGGMFNPTDFKVYGSNDDTNWDELLSKTGFSVAAVAANDATKLIDADTSTRAYKYFALVITKKVSGTYQYVHVHELRYFGHRVNDLVRFPDSTTVRKFPDTVMASNGPQRGYTVSASGAPNPSYDSYHAFNNITANGNGSWHSESSYATSGTRESSTSTLSSWTGGGGGHNGAWLKIQLPNKIVLNNIIFIQRPTYGIQQPRLFSIVGSNDDSNWYLVHEETSRTFTGATAPNPDPHTMSGPYASTAWKYFAVVIRTGSTDNISDHVSIGDWELYGTEVAEPVLARLGGSFEGKIANTRVYDRSIGERQVLEIWDAEKDRFGRGESSITVHKGRLGVGTKTPQATLDVRGNIFGPLLTHRSYVWRKPGITYLPASQECRILAQVVEIPEMYKNISPLNLRLSYLWQHFGETNNGQGENHVWRTNVKHSGNTVEHMNTGMEGGRFIGVSMSLITYTVNHTANTPEIATIPGSYELKNVTGDTFEVELSLVSRIATTMNTNRTINSADSSSDERGCSTLTVFMEPY